MKIRAIGVKKGILFLNANGFHTLYAPLGRIWKNIQGVPFLLLHIKMLDRICNFKTFPINVYTKILHRGAATVQRDVSVVCCCFFPIISETVSDKITKFL